MKKRTPDPVWFDVLREGDVLRSPTGALRVVREVARWTRRLRSGGGVGQLQAVTFAIRKRSWTNRCYTTYSANDLKSAGWQYTGARIRLTSDLDQCIAAAIALPCHAKPFMLYAKHVRGVP